MIVIAIIQLLYLLPGKFLQQIVFDRVAGIMLVLG